MHRLNSRGYFLILCTAGIAARDPHLRHILLSRSLRLPSKHYIIPHTPNHYTSVQSRLFVCRVNKIGNRIQPNARRTPQPAVIVDWAPKREYVEDKSISLLLHKVPVLAVEQGDGLVVVFQVEVVPVRNAPHFGHLVVARDLPDDLDEAARERSAAAGTRHAHILVVLYKKKRGLRGVNVFAFLAGEHARRLGYFDNTTRAEHGRVLNIKGGRIRMYDPRELNVPRP